jgi:hypothetical protein
MSLDIITVVVEVDVAIINLMIPFPCHNETRHGSLPICDMFAFEPSFLALALALALVSSGIHLKFKLGFHFSIIPPY